MKKNIVAALLVLGWLAVSFVFLRTAMAYDMWSWWNTTVTRQAYIPHSGGEAMWWEPLAMAVGVLIPAAPCILLGIVLLVVYRAKSLSEAVAAGLIFATMALIAVCVLALLRDFLVMLESGDCVGGTARRETWNCSEPPESDHWLSWFGYMVTQWRVVLGLWAAAAAGLTLWFCVKPLPELPEPANSGMPNAT